jgi:hypothetical protein
VNEFNHDNWWFVILSVSLACSTMVGTNGLVKADGIYEKFL